MTSYLSTLSKCLKQKAASGPLLRLAKASLVKINLVKVPAWTLLLSLAAGMLSSADAAKAYSKSSWCSGSGQILSGEGRGGTLSLALEKSYVGSNEYIIELRGDYFGGDRFRIRPYSTISRSYGRWIAEEISNSEMFLTLQYSQPYLVVSYVLSCQ